MILSVSRRTDIPAFYSDWFFERLKDGFVLVPNPINRQKVAKIDINPLKIKGINSNLLGDKVVETQGNVEGIVFWTKNPCPMMSRLNELGDIKYYFLYTLNPYPREIEANLPSLEERIENFKQLSKFCPVIWRYDPILLANGIDVEWHIKNFKNLCQQLKGYTNRCKISFVIESYKGCSKNVWAPSFAQKHQIMAAFSQIAMKNGIQIEACAEGDDWSKYGILPSKCINGEIFVNLLNEKFKAQNIIVKRKDNKFDGQRKNCLCMPSVDIGQYDQPCKKRCSKKHVR